MESVNSKGGFYEIIIIINISSKELLTQIKKVCPSIFKFNVYQQASKSKWSKFDLFKHSKHF